MPNKVPNRPWEMISMDLIISPTTDFDTRPGRMVDRKNSRLMTKIWKKQIPCQIERIHSRR